MPIIEQVEQETFHIPATNMLALHTKIEKMNRKAAQIGCPAVSIEVIREYRMVHPAYKEPDNITPDEWLPQISMREVVVHGEGPKIEGWKFVGTLDLVTLPGSTIVKTVPDESVPQQYYTHDGSCDHCEKIRRRNDTFVLEGTDENVGQHQVVGRNCLKDFFGHDPSQIARFLTSLWKFMSTMEDEERGFGGCGRGTESFDHHRVLQATFAIIRAEGWRAKSACRDNGETSTAELVLEIFSPPPIVVQEHRDWVESLNISADAYAADATAAMVWLNEQPHPAGNEYMHNLHQIADADAVPTKLFGYWCSLASAYKRAHERLVRQKAEQELITNEYLSDEIRTRVQLDITLIAIRSFDGSYGTVHIHRMIDSTGRTIIWFANARPTMTEGNKYRISGTVKKKDEFKGFKQTHLNRVRVIQEIE